MLDGSYLCLSGIAEWKLVVDIDLLIFIIFVHKKGITGINLDDTIWQVDFIRLDVTVEETI
jgi:hypothetical protein